MKHLSKYYPIYIGPLALLIVLLVVITWSREPVYKDKIVYKTKTITVKAEPAHSFVSIGPDDLSNDLETHYSHLAKRQRKLVLDTLEEVSKTYKINPLILYSLISVESSFRPWITHSQVTIQGKKTNGIGLGGIIYLWWGEKLKKAGILETKSELYDIDTNIRAIGFVFNEMKQLPLKKGTVDQTTSAMRRYFGANFRSYSDKIKLKISQLIAAKLYKDK